MRMLPPLPSVSAQDSCDWYAEDSYQRQNGEAPANTHAVNNPLHQPNTTCTEQATNKTVASLDCRTAVRIQIREERTADGEDADLRSAIEECHDERDREMSRAMQGPAIDDN